MSVREKRGIEESKAEKQQQHERVWQAEHRPKLLTLAQEQHQAMHVVQLLQH
jgi:hypothetical protein